MWLFRLRDNRIPFAAIACVALSAGCNSHEAETEDRQAQPTRNERSRQNGLRHIARHGRGPREEKSVTATRFGQPQPLCF